MKRPSGARALILSLALCTLGFSPAGGPEDEGSFSVFLRLLTTSDASVTEVTHRLEAAYARAGWDVVASVETGSIPGRCEATGNTLVLYSPAWASQILPAGPHAAFAVPLRLTVFEDEQGVQVSVMDPRSLMRTMVVEEGMSSEWDRLTAELVQVTREAFPEAGQPEGFGQWRNRGRIGRTFGIMAGGPFPEKVEEVVVLEDDPRSPAELAHVLMENMDLPGQWDWNMRPVFSLDLTDDLTIVGITGDEMEARAFQIVGNGNQPAREGLACAGVDHAPAFPINLVIQRYGPMTRVTMVDEMFRMKMYFEDAGKMAFARNMSMPGSIENEIRDKVELVLQSF